MMPYCQYIGCDKVADFLGPNELPAACEEHLGMLMERIHQYMKRKNDPLKPDGDYKVHDESAEVVLKDIGHLIGSKMPDGYGFTFLMFTFGEGGNLFYISNSRREDMIKSMEEFIEKHKGENDGR